MFAIVGFGRLFGTDGDHVDPVTYCQLGRDDTHREGAHAANPRCAQPVSDLHPRRLWNRKSG